MKNRWLIAMMMLPLLWGCSSENDIPGGGNEEPEEELPISMSASTSAATRADIDEDATKALRKFWVYGWKTVRETDKPIMEQQEVSRTSATDPWTYSPLRYWDRAASKYLFVGYVSSDPTANVSVNETNHKLTFSNIPQWQLTSYSVTTFDTNYNNSSTVTETKTLDNAATKDYMISRSTDTPTNYLSSSTPGVVHLDFYHLLSKLNIKAFCAANDGVQAETKYLIESVTLSSFPDASVTPLVETAQQGIPNTDNVLSQYWFEYKKDIPSDGTILDNTGYSTFSKKTSDPTNQGDVALYPVQDIEKNVATQYLLLPSTKADALLVSSWMVAPFDLADIYGTSPSTPPCLALQVVYSAHSLDGTLINQYTSQWIKITDSEGNLLTKFEPNTEYTLVLDVQKGTLEVLLDVAILPWIESNTLASPHTVYNW